MAYPSVNITRLSNQLSRQGADSGEGVAALVAGANAVVDGAQLGTVYVLYGVAGAEALGITSEYDTTNVVLLHYHISEFFALNPTGELHVLLAPRGTTLANMANKANNYLKKVLREGDGRIRKAGIVLNPTLPYTSTLDDGLDADVLAAIPLAQALADEEYTEGRPINNIVIEGREFNGTVGAAADLRALTGGPYRDVTVCIAQDPAVAALNAGYAKTAAVGAYLGMATKKTVSESFAQAVDKFNLLRTDTGRFVSAALSSGTLVSAMTTADLTALHNKGYVFVRSFAGTDGYWFNQSSVCAPVTDDYNFSEMRDVMNFVVRLIQPTMIKYINSTEFRVDSAGRIVRIQAAAIEGEVLQSTTGAQDHVSEISFVRVDPARSNVGVAYPSFLSDRVLRLLIGIRPKGKAEVVNVEIGYTAAV